MEWIPVTGSGGGVTASNPLEGKVWNVLGDSLTEVNFHATKFYHQYIKEWDSMAQVNNYGSSGRNIITMSTMYTTMTDTVDYVTVFGGVNDFGQGQPLGTFGDTTSSSFYGACDVLFKGLLTKYPTKKIGYIAPHHQNGYFAETEIKKLETYVNAAIQVARYYAIPTLDLYHEGTVCPMVDAHKTLYTTDGLHFTTAGQERIAVQIRNFLKRL